MDAIQQNILTSKGSPISAYLFISDKIKQKYTLFKYI